MRVVIVSGVPGSGKTTVARALAEGHERSVHIEGDRIGHELIVSGLVPPHGEPAAEATAQLVLRRHNICLLADSFCDAGFAVFIDDVVVSHPVLERYLADLVNRPLALVLLAPRIDIVEDRDRRRDKHAFHLWKHLDAQMRQEMAGIGLWVDTSEMTVDETVEAILADLDQANGYRSVIRRPI